MTCLVGLFIALPIASAVPDNPPVQRPSGVLHIETTAETEDASVEAPEEVVAPPTPRPVEPPVSRPFEPTAPLEPTVAARQGEPTGQRGQHGRNAAILLALSPVPLGLAAGMQYWAYHRYRKYCFHDPMYSDGLESIGEALGHGVGCGVSLVGTGFVRTGGVVFLAGTVSMATIGSAMLGSHAGRRDRLAGTSRNTGALVGLGAGLVVAGTAAAITSGSIFTRRIWASETDEASLANVRWRSITFDASTVGIAVGAGMLAYAVAYRRAQRKRGDLSWWPMIGPTFIGVSGFFG